MKKLLFILNPCSGKGQIRNQLLDIVDIFNRHGYQVTVHVTQEVADAMHVVRKECMEYDLVVCSGGDGTLNEVVSGMMQAGCSSPVGYIPAGSTNDFAVSLKIPKNMKRAARMIMEGQPFLCDIGSFNERFFNYVAAFGAFTEVSYATPQQMKNLLGHQAYLIEGVKSLTSIKPAYMRIHWQGQVIEGEFIYGMVTNARSVGGFKKLVGKSVLMDDGEFEVTLIRKPKKPLEMQEILTSLLMEEMSSDYLLTFKASELTIESLEEAAWVLDGEFGGNPKKIKIKNLHKALKIICS